MLFTKARSISFKQLVDTISQERQFQERDLFIGESGLNNMVKYPKDRTFTILMEIGVIMKLGIYRLFHVVNTYLTTLKNGIKILFTELRLMLVGRRQYSKHQNGIGRKMEGHGIHNTEKTHGKAERKSCKPVLFAVNTLKQVSSAQNTVPQHAQINILGITAKRLNLFVNIVVKSLWRKVLMLRKRTVVAVHVEQSCVGPTKTYNLTLEKHNVYFANNILVENCADALLLAYEGMAFPDDIRDAMRRRRDVEQASVTVDEIATVHGSLMIFPISLPGKKNHQRVHLRFFLRISGTLTIRDHRPKRKTMPRLKVEYPDRIPGEKRIAINGVTVYYYNEHQIFDCLRDIDRARRSCNTLQGDNQCKFPLHGDERTAPNPTKQQRRTPNSETGQTAYKSIMN